MYSIMKQSIRMAMFISLACLVIFSGGCSKDSTAPENDGQPTTPAFDADGIWVGGCVFQDGNNTQTMPVSAFIAPDGRIYMLVPDTSYLFLYNLGAYGTLEKANDVYQGTLPIFAPGFNTGGTLEITNGKVLDVKTGDQTYHTLVANFSGSAAPFDGSGELTLTRIDTVYNLPSSLSQLAGHWSFFDPEDQTQTFLDVTASGAFTGGNTAGCQFAGMIKMINPDKNLYNIQSFTIQGCEQPWDGSYEGLATLEDGEFNVVIVKQDKSFGFFMSFSR
jgi:hypothetical protein